MTRTLLIGYGNPDRQDDGVAWHILQAYCKKLGLSVPGSYEDEFPQSEALDFAFYLQLTPEMAEEICQYEQVCFVDAHTGFISEEVRLIDVESEFQHSPFTHHLTAQSLLSMCETIYHKKPRAGLLSVRGYYFGFNRDLSPDSAALVPEAVKLLDEWIGGN
ncbi:MAG: hypothetical protein WCP19_07240 [Chloroflexota bacterium]